MLLRSAADVVAEVVDARREELRLPYAQSKAAQVEMKGSHSHDTLPENSNSMAAAPTPQSVVDAATESVISTIAYMPIPSRDDVYAFLRRVNPVMYGSEVCRTAEQQRALDDITDGMLAAMTAVASRSPTGQLPVEECPLRYADEDERNVWALDGRQRATTRAVGLPLVGLHTTIGQCWRHEPKLKDAAGEDNLEGHSTTGVCWDGAVVVADMVCHHPVVLV